MQSRSVFLDIATFRDLWYKNDDASRTQVVCHVIHLFFGSSLGKVLLCQVSSLQDIWVTILERGAFSPPIREQPRKNPP